MPFCSEQGGNISSRSARPAWDTTHPFVQRPLLSTLHSHGSLSNWPGDRINCPGIAGLVFKSPSCNVMTAPKCEHSDAGHSDVPRRRRKVSVCRTHNARGDRSHPQFQAFTGGLGTQPPTDEGGRLTPYLTCIVEKHFHI